MNYSNRVSIIVPVFNAASTLPTFLSSVLNQSDGGFELIVVNDGSTDESAEILERAARSDHRIQVITQENRGLSHARNLGLQSASGRWVAFFDSDDWLHPDLLRTWLTAAEAADVDFLMGNGFRFSSDTELNSPENLAAAAILKKQAWSEVMTGRDWIVRSVGVGEWPHFVWLQFVRREFLALSGARFVEGIVHEDILWTLGNSLLASRIGFSGDVLYGYRVNPNSIMNNPSSAAVERRASSYVVVLSGILEAAVSVQQDPGLSHALFRQLNVEAGHLLGLMRKKLKCNELRQKIARDCFRRGLVTAMFKGAGNPKERWRALRCWGYLKAYAMGL